MHVEWNVASELPDTRILGASIRQAETRRSLVSTEPHMMRLARRAASRVAVDVEDP